MPVCKNVETSWWQECRSPWCPSMRLLVCSALHVCWGKVMVTVFVSGCLFTKGCLQSVFQQFPSSGKIWKSSGKGGLQRAGRSILTLWEKKVAQIQSMLSVPSPVAFQMGYSVLIFRTEEPVNCNWSFNTLQALFFHSLVIQSIQSYPSDTKYIQFHFPLFLSRLNENTIFKFHSRSMQIPYASIPDS